MREIITNWTLQGGRPAYSVMYFLGGGLSLPNQRTALGNFWDAVDALLSNTVTWAIATTGRVLDPATGTLTGAWTESTAQTGAGAVSGPRVADATQMLAQWGTDEIRDGRFIKGRTYVPGMTDGGLLDGTLNNTFRTTLATAAQDLVDADVGFGVWSRPKGGTGGVFAEATSGAAWDRLAVLRDRRD